MAAEVASPLSSPSKASNPPPSQPPAASQPAGADLAPAEPNQTIESRTEEDGPEAGLAQTALAQEPPPLSPQDSVDFLLHPAELAKGRRAAENYLSSFRSDDSRRLAEEALETLATVISGGKCDTVDFPWQQVRPYHGAAALTILKEKGAPSRIETLRCRRDTTRGFRVVPDAYPPRQVQKIRSTLSKVIEQCTELGYVSDSVVTEAEAAPSPKKKTTRSNAKTKAKGTSSKPRSSKAGRLLGDGELRALVAASAADADAEGHRDAVLFSLAYRGLKIAEITALTPESVKFNTKTGGCTIVARPARGGSRGRRIELNNTELICIEDWLDHRGTESGPLLSTVVRGKVEGKRLTTAMLKEICTRRAAQAEVADFTPNDVSRSAEALTEHRKAAKRKAARLAQSNPSDAERVLFDGSSTGLDSNLLGETIRFPFQGLDI